MTMFKFGLHFETERLEDLPASHVKVKLVTDIRNNLFSGRCVRTGPANLMRIT